MKNVLMSFLKLGCFWKCRIIASGFLKNTGALVINHGLKMEWFQIHLSFLFSKNENVFSWKQSVLIFSTEWIFMFYVNFGLQKIIDDTSQPNSYFRLSVMDSILFPSKQLKILMLFLNK